MRHRSVAPFLSLLLAAVPAGHALAQPAQVLDLHQVMADPDWIGQPVERMWWSWDGGTAYYSAKRIGSNIRDTYAQPIAGGAATLVDGAARGGIDALNPLYDVARNRMAFVRNGDVFVRDLRGGTLQQLTRSEALESQLQWARDGALVWRSGNDWFRWSAATGVGQAASLKAEDAPGTPPKADELRERQLRYIETLRVERARRDGMREQADAWRRADATRAPAPAYLGKGVEIQGSALSPDGRWLLAVTQAKGAESGQKGKMPQYVTESGYEEFEDVRTRVGRADPAPQSFWLVSVADGQVRELKTDSLPGITADPLAALRKAAGQDALKGHRAVRIEAGGPDGITDAARWSDDSRGLALMLHSVDNKDRWLATVDLAQARLQPVHRLTDAAWINWGFNDFGWMPDGGDLWFLSEESGWSHLYRASGGRARALTSGRWEASMPVLSADGRGFLFLCNRARPGDYEVCQVDAAGGEVRELTTLDGVEDFVASPDGSHVLVRHSSSYVPPQLSVVEAAGGSARQLTDTRSAEFKRFDWLQPEYVQVPSKHGAGTVWGKYYGPATMEPGRTYPVVMFVHGAGYLQNVSDRYPNYFREQMFHNLLVQQGYIVLDLDFRASEGYGRDWRTAIYRQMGHPELEDHLDGIDWLVAHKQADRERVGIYGGSYGGFLTFMALFREAGTFKAGAALRPVSDWSQYNHAYTANILNTPALDPGAYAKSSPLEYAEGLQDHLLIAHGMIDDNVFYKDSVMLAQRLIELRKDKWELASYPLERHGFVHADSWYDEYRRILELFNRTLKAP
ncbi:S9 family peptidase [Luteimonas sp. MC1572]|uniref:S9 family peptidase n=1 Tax=Luteimonas sp. MC1572 TaxID=2799325 RepID=UPI0018F0C9B4|nr:S9 family peptidase [Luteimonas sp. MC1572]MBJ6981739.1 prolyl oligopeptidase family serine peptidase [Luteimonas sp. MC1572]QQO03027.1 prolyl oligopeptidase family serine peptidase [Luteimonas sp. MC1572]